MTMSRSILLWHTLLLGSSAQYTPPPPRGWNAWFALHKAVNESGIRQTAKALVDLGLADAGFTFVNVDDGWQGSRSADGRITSDNRTFPSGIAALALYVHSLNLSFGIYTDRGTSTCGGRPGSRGHEKLDAETYASWGIDYVKSDSCSATHSHHEALSEYATLGEALSATGRPIFYSGCGWMKWYAAGGAAHAWRVGPDAST